MARYPDLARCDYFGDDHQLIAVGWLERGDRFARGEVDAQAFSRLCELLAQPFQPFAYSGSHGCSLCRFTAEAHGTRNLFVPKGTDLFVAPELIVHYINAHEYAPPQVFLTAVLACPDTHSIDYKRAFLAAGGGTLLRAAS